MVDSVLDPIDEALAPLARSIGRAVMGAAALEKVSGLLRALGADIPALIDTIANLDPAQVDDPKLRQQFKALQELNLPQLRDLFDDAQSRG